MKQGDVGRVAGVEPSPRGLARPLAAKVGRWPSCRSEVPMPRESDVHGGSPLRKGSAHQTAERRSPMEARSPVPRGAVVCSTL